MAIGASTRACSSARWSSGQAVDGGVEEVGPRVLEAVPARVVGGVAQPEVGAEVDDRGAGGDKVRRRAPAAVPWGRARKTASRRSGSVGVDRQVGRRQMRVDAADRIVVALATDEADELDVRVAREQADELAADIAGRADDPDADPPRPAGRVDARARSAGRTPALVAPGLGSAGSSRSHDYTRPLHSHASSRSAQLDRARDA